MSIYSFCHSTHLYEFCQADLRSVKKSTGFFYPLSARQKKKTAEGPSGETFLSVTEPLMSAAVFFTIIF